MWPAKLPVSVPRIVSSSVSPDVAEKARHLCEILVDRLSCPSVQNTTPAVIPPFPSLLNVTENRHPGGQTNITELHARLADGLTLTLVFRPSGRTTLTFYFGNHHAILAHKEFCPFGMEHNAAWFQARYAALCEPQKHKSDSTQGSPIVFYTPPPPRFKRPLSPLVQCIHLKHTEQMIHLFHQAEHLPAQELLSLLDARDEQGRRVLDLAIQAGEDEVTETFLNELKTLLIRRQPCPERATPVPDALVPAQLMALLSDGIDTPSLLYTAMYKGTLWCVSHLMNFLIFLASNKFLRSVEVGELLKGLSANRECALSRAMFSNQADKIRVYLSAIHRLDVQNLLNSRLILKLLTADTDGMPVLFAPMTDGHRQAVTAYLEGVQTLAGQHKYRWEQIRPLLAAVYDESPALHIALVNNHAAAVKAYIGGVKSLVAHYRVSPGEILQLLAPTDNHCLTLRQVALAKGSYDAMAVFLAELSAWLRPPGTDADRLNHEMRSSSDRGAWVENCLQRLREGEALISMPAPAALHAITDTNAQSLCRSLVQMLASSPRNSRAIEGDEYFCALLTGLSDISQTSYQEKLQIKTRFEVHSPRFLRQTLTLSLELWRSGHALLILSDYRRGQQLGRQTFTPYGLKDMSTNSPWFLLRYRAACRQKGIAPARAKPGDDDETFAGRYLPTHARDAQLVSINGVASFPSQGNKPGITIFCRHLAGQYGEDVLSHPHGKVPLREHYTTPDALSQHVSPTWEARYNTLRDDPPVGTSVVGSNDFGDLLAVLFRQMRAHNVPIMAALIGTTTHALAARLRIKQQQEENGAQSQDVFVVSVYDPNSTNLAIRRRSTDPGLFPSLSGFIAPSLPFIAVWLQHEVADQAVVVHPMLPATAPEDMLKDLAEELPAPPLHCSTLNLQMETGNVRLLSALFTRLRTLSLEGMMNILLSDTPALFFGLAHGQAAAVTAYFAFVRELARDYQLSNEQLFALARAKRKQYGTTGLHSIMEYGYVDTILTYLGVLSTLATQFTFSKKQVWTLIADKRDNGRTPFAVAVYVGQKASIMAWFDGIKPLADRYQFRGEEILSLLEEEEVDGITILHRLMRQSGPRQVNTYLYSVLLAERRYLLSPQAIVTLLEGKRRHDRSSLHVALEAGNAGTVKAYIAGVIRMAEMLPLSPPQLLSLLTPVATNGVSFLDIAREKQQMACVNAYLSGISMLPEPFSWCRQQLASWKLL